MPEQTDRFALPLLVPGQAQKEFDHNEALTTVDALLFPVVEALPENSPPAAPEPGQAWIVGSNPVEEWHDRAGALACWTAGGWRFAAPVPGMTAWLKPERLWMSYDGGAWRTGVLAAKTLVIGGEQVVGARQAAISEPAGGATVDGQARAALVAVLAALRAHGLIAE